MKESQCKKFHFNVPLLKWNNFFNGLRPKSYFQFNKALHHHHNEFKKMNKNLKIGFLISTKKMLNVV